MTRGRRRLAAATEKTEPGAVYADRLRDGTEVEYVHGEDGTMRCVAPPRFAGMTLARRNDGTRTMPGSLKLVGKPSRG